MHKFLYLLLIQIISMPCAISSLKLSMPSILLPYNPGSTTNFTLKLIDSSTEKCGIYQWQSFSSDAIIIPIYPSNGICPSEAIISVLPTATESFETVISVCSENNNCLFCDVAVDMVHKIELQFSTSKIYLHGPPIAIDVIAKNKDGSSFTSVSQLKFVWSVKGLDSTNVETSNNIVKFLDHSQSSYFMPNVTTPSVLMLQGENVGTVKVKASLKHAFYDNILPAEMTLNVTLSENIKPSGPIYVLKGAKVSFFLETRYGNVLDISSYSFEVLNNSVASMDNNVLTTIDYGETVIIAAKNNKNTFIVKCYVVEPTNMSIDLYSSKDWKLHEGKTYEIIVKLWDAENHEIFLSEDVQFRTLFPSNLFHVNSSSNGVQHKALALVPGSGTIRSQFLGIKKQGQLHKLIDLNASKRVVIYQSMQIFPSVLLLPFYENSSALYDVKFKVSGGTGHYYWTTDDPMAKVTYNNDNINQALVHFHDKGDFVINVADKNSSQFGTSAKVSIQLISDIEVYPTVVEAEIGNEILLPVGILGFANKESKIYHTFDDCSKINISFEIIEKHILKHKPSEFIPPFGRGCRNLLFQCLFPGHTRINILYESEKNLKTTVVVSCFKPLKPIHPVRVGVLALGTSKEVAFEGGPRPWPLFADGHILKCL